MRSSTKPFARACRRLLVIALFTLAAPSLAHAQDERPYDPRWPVPPGHHVEKDPNLVLLITGPAFFTVSYSIGVGLAADYGFADQGGWMLAPGIGPFVYLATREGCANDVSELEGAVCGFGETMLGMATVLGGLMQVSGLAMLTVGLATMDDVVVPDEPSPSISVVPTPLPQGGGVAVMGRF